MFKSNHNVQQLISQIQPLIENLNPRFGSIPTEWSNVQEQLLSMINLSPELANNSELICSLVILASKFSDSNALQFLKNCVSNGIGSSHSLWYSSIALELEKQNDFILAIDAFEHAIEIHAEPYPFLDLKYSEFKKRMIDRFQSVMNQKGDINNSLILELGKLDGTIYTFNNGEIITSPIGQNSLQIPKYDVFKILGYSQSSITSTPMTLTAHNSLASINISNNNTSKQEVYKLGYNPDLIIGPDERECSFEEKRLLSYGINFIENRKLDANISIQQSNPDSPIEQPTLPKKASKNRKPFQLIEPPAQLPEQKETTDLPFLYNEDDKPIPILKNKQNAANSNRTVNINKNAPSIGNNSSINPIVHNSSLSFIDNNNNNSIHPVAVSPRNSRSGSGVTFNNSTMPFGSAEKRRSPTPISRPSSILIENEIISSSSNIIGNLTIEKKIGDRSYLAIGSNSSYVVKRLTYSDAQNQAIKFVNLVQHKELFALQADEQNQSPDYFITNYYSRGNLENVIDISRSGKLRFDQNISFFFLFQMTLILQQLEANSFIHGEINEKNLFLRTSPDEIPKTFSMNEKGWRDTGLVLIRCDQIQKISSTAPQELRMIDRKSVYSLFIKLSINKEQTANEIVPYDCPTGYNKAIWKMAFDTLSSQNTLDPLISLIISELEHNALALRSKISRVAICTMT